MRRLALVWLFGIAMLGLELSALMWMSSWGLSSTAAAEVEDSAAAVPITDSRD